MQPRSRRLSSISDIASPDLRRTILLVSVCPGGRTSVCIWWCMAGVCRSRVEGGMIYRPAATTDLAAETEV